MTRISITFLLAIGHLLTAKADTIDFWHIYYNGIKIKEYNLYSKGEIVFKIEDIKQTDSLTVKYFRDTPCSSCETQVAIESYEKHVIAKGLGRGTFNPIKISVYDLLQYYLNEGSETCEVFYLKRRITNQIQKTSIFRIKLE